MNQTIELLIKAAELETKSYTDYVTAFSSSGISALVKGGVEFEKAASMVQEACEVDPKLVNIMTNIMAFEKAAEIIQQQELEIAELKKTASELPEPKTTEEENTFNKLASAGFSKDEIEVMSQLPEQILTKVASAGSQPWEMGGGVGIPREKTDALLEFILG
jgi:hypothetical protein